MCVLITGRLVVVDRTRSECQCRSHHWPSVLPCLSGPSGVCSVPLIGKPMCVCVDWPSLIKKKYENFQIGNICFACLGQHCKSGKKLVPNLFGSKIVRTRFVIRLRRRHRSPWLSYLETFSLIRFHSRSVVSFWPLVGSEQGKTLTIFYYRFGGTCPCLSMFATSVSEWVSDR